MQPPARREPVNELNMSPNPPCFSEVVIVLRRQLALSQEELARQLGVSYATVNRWENGRTHPSQLARAQLDAFCEKMRADGQLVRPEAPHP